MGILFSRNIPILATQGKWDERFFSSHPIARGNGLNIRCQKVFLIFFSDATYGNLLLQQINRIF